jgi:hypothetical protein
MTKLLITISFLLFVGSPFANAEQVYYCAEKITNGIMKNKKTGEWERKAFMHKRHTIKFNGDYTKLDGLMQQYYCLKPTGYKDTLIVCYENDNGGGVFSFDKEKLRFLLLRGSLFGYVSNEGDDNWITAGTCKKF